MENYKFIFHCDRNACGDRCSYPTCRMTFDPNHAVNFVKREIEGNTYYEEIPSEELTTLYSGDINIGLNNNDSEFPVDNRFATYPAPPLKEVEETKIEIDEALIHQIIEHAMEKRDRSVSIFFGEGGVSINVYPYPEENEEDEEQ